MQYVRDTLWNIIQERLFRKDTLDRLTDALIPILHERIITYLTKGFDVHVKDVLVPKVGPKEEYIVYESTRPATLWFLVDLSSAREGDLFKIRLYIRLSDGEFLLHDHYELENQRREPIATLSSRFAPACRLTVTQSRGLSKEVGYEVFGRYEGK